MDENGVFCGVFISLAALSHSSILGLLSHSIHALQKNSLDKLYFGPVQSWCMMDKVRRMMSLAFVSHGV